jgi:hypothetical protein
MITLERARGLIGQMVWFHADDTVFLAGTFLPGWHQVTVTGVDKDTVYFASYPYDGQVTAKNGVVECLREEEPR